jgi:tetratricopeptide (TPR) repeat protein
LFDFLTYNKPYGLKLQIIIGLLFLLLALGLVYAKTIDFAYVDWDDYENYVENPHITDIQAENLLTHFQHDRYKSLALYSFMLDYQLWQYNPGLSHLVNVLLHGLNSILLLLLILKLTGSNKLSLFTAMLFALHPTVVEPVVWITGRKDLLFFLFTILGLLAYIKYVKHNKSIFWLLISSIFIYLASMAKIQAFTIPIMLFAFDYFYQRKVNINLFLEKLFLILLLFDFFILSATLFFLIITIHILLKSNSKTSKDYIPLAYLSSILLIILSLSIDFTLSILLLIVVNLAGAILIKRKIIRIHNKREFFRQWKPALIQFGIVAFFIMLKETGGISRYIPQFWDSETLNDYNFTHQLLLGGSSFVFYLKRLFLLSSYNPMVKYPEDMALLNSGQYIAFTILSLFILICFILFIKKYYRHHRLIILGGLVFLINIGIVMHIIPIEGQVVAADRYTYPAFWGLFLIISYLISKISRQSVQVSIILVILILFIFQSNKTIPVWKNSTAFWGYAIKKDNKNAFAYNAYGLALFELEDDTIAAITNINQAIKLKPKVSKFHNDKGRLLYISKQSEQGLQSIVYAISIDTTNATAYYNRGAIYQTNGEFQLAIEDFSQALKIEPNNKFYQKKLISCKYDHGIDSIIRNKISDENQTTEILEFIDKYSQIFITKENWENAISYLEYGIQIKPEHTEWLNNLATCNSLRGDYEKSINYYDRLITLSPNNSQWYLFRGNNYFNMNLFEKACQDWQFAAKMGNGQAKKHIETYCKN